MLRGTTLPGLKRALLDHQPRAFGQNAKVVPPYSVCPSVLGRLGEWGVPGAVRPHETDKQQPHWTAHQVRDGKELGDGQHNTTNTLPPSQAGKRRHPPRALPAVRVAACDGQLHPCHTKYACPQAHCAHPHPLLPACP